MADSASRPVGERYRERLAARSDLAASLARRATWISNVRLGVFAAGLVAAWFVFGTRSLAPVVLIPLVVAFLILVVWHDRVLRSRSRADRAVAFYEGGLARLEDRWSGCGESGERYRPEHHLYSEDLDLFGRGSLFELLDTARTHTGEALLASWLLAPATPEVVKRRQAAVAELAPLLDLREDLAVLGEHVRSGLHADALRRWGEGAPPPPPVALRWVAAGFAALSVATLAAWILGVANALPFVAALLVQSVFALVLRRRVRAQIAQLDLPVRDLGLIADLVGRLETERFESERLLALGEAMRTEGVPASRRIVRLRLLGDLLDARRNQIFAPLGALLIWTTQVALAIEAWRATCGPALPAWLDALGEFEALACLAGYAFENPEHVFPEVVASETPVFEGEELGHPLLPRDRCVANDLAFTPERRLFIVSGSNMSGKSTLLRTLGTNAVLALAGAPVRARRLRLSPLAVGASIRIHDSLQEGNSRFYAEITRIRDVMQLCEREHPVLYLLDEILHGTNSHDRRIGAEAIVRGLLGRGGLGLVTTHDLALTQVVGDLAPRAANVHFEDHLENGRVEFDYRMRPGVVTKSNALELMRAVGLDV